MAKEYTVVRVMMGPGTTIDAVLKFHNSLKMSREELVQLRAIFKKLNKTQPPVMGQGADIPILTKYKRS